MKKSTLCVAAAGLTVFAISLAGLAEGDVSLTYGKKTYVDESNRTIEYCGPSEKCDCPSGISSPSPIVLLSSSSGTGPTLPGSSAGICPTCGSSPGGGPSIGGGGTVGIGCSWVLIGAGNNRVGSALGAGFFRIWAERPIASLYTPQTLRFVRSGYGMHGISKDKTAGGVPRQVNVINPEGLIVIFDFANNASIGTPWGSAKHESATRLFMTDAQGWAVTNDPAYYDLYTGGGDLYRFVAATNSQDYLQMTLYKSVGGRQEDASDWGTDVVFDGDGILRQVKSAASLADITTVNDSAYNIKFYKLAHVESGKDTNGYYVVTSNAVPLTVWTIENPEPTTLKKLRISKTSGTKTNVSDYVYTAESDEWQLSSGGGLKIESEDRIWNDAHTYRMRTHMVRGDNGQVVSKRTAKSYVFPWHEDVIEEVVDPDGEALKTEYAYYENSGEAYRYSKLKSEKHPDGSWVVYDYNSNGYKSVEIRPWKDSPFDSSAGTARATYYDYTPVAAGDSLVFNDQRPRTVTEKILGVTVAKTYHAFVTNSVGELQEIVEHCSEPTAAYGAASSLRTTTTHYGTNVASFKVSLVKSTEYPDGRLDSFDYEYGTFHSTNSSPAEYWFEPNPNGSAIRITATHGTANSPSGMANRTTRDTRVLDEYGRVTLSETSVYTGGTNYHRIAWSVPEYDDYFHVTTMNYSDGRREEQSWGSNCCGKESDTDASGIERAYDYDLLNRLIATTKKGANSPTGDFKTETTYDAAGRILTTRTSGGSLSLVTGSNTYNLAGQLVSAVDSMGLTTTYAPSGGGLTNTVVSPGGLTNVTVRYVDGRTKYATENGVSKTWQDYGVNDDGSQWTMIYTGPNGTNSPMWSRTFTDLLGRTIRDEKPGFSSVPSVLSVVTNIFFYDSKGQLVKTTSPGLADTAFAFDEMGRQVRQGRVEDGSTNWLSGSEDVYETVDSAFWRTRYALVFPVDTDTAVTTSVQRVRLTGLSSNLTSETVSIDVRRNQTVARTAVNRAAKTVTQAVDYPDSTNYAVTLTSNGLLSSSTSKTGVNTTFEYDAMERQTAVRSTSAGGSRSTATMTAYNGQGQVDWTEDAASNRTSFAYDPDTGRRVAMTNALGEVTYTQYDVEGRVTNNWGATYPVAYAYDDFGRMTEMHTWRQEGGSPDVTRWLYDEATGLLTNKVYADGLGPVYAYTAEGKLASRAWARGVTTEYAYAACCGALTNLSYSDGTPSIGFTLDRLGRQVTVTDGMGTRTFTYNDAMQLAAETNAYGVISRQYDALGRNAGLTLDDSDSVQYGYSDVGRFASFASVLAGQSNGWAYSYLPGADLMAGWMPAASGVAFSRNFEANRDLLTSVTNVAGGLLLSAFDYQNDALGRRTQRIDAGGAVATNSFAYDSLSQLTNARMNGLAFDWTFDPIGNRQTDTSNFVTHVYAANALNQYTTITNGGVRTLAYDLDGNLTNDGQFAYSWDGENRLAIASNGNTKLTFAYDYMGRRVSKKVYVYSDSWLLTSDSSFLYDGWNLVREVVIVGGTVSTNLYCWGVDLSGTLQGAGGSGGLLAVIRDGVAYYPCYDANGNISDYVDASGTIVAHREYDAYGGTAVPAGPLKDAFSFWFSSKYLDAETGIYYYGYRYYSPSLGRWLSRDPIGDWAFLSFYSQGKSWRDRNRLASQSIRHTYHFVDNQPFLLTDALGLMTVAECMTEFNNRRNQSNSDLLSNIGACGMSVGLGTAVCIGGCALGNLVPGVGQFFFGICVTITCGVDACIFASCLVNAGTIYKNETGSHKAFKCSCVPAASDYDPWTDWMYTIDCP